MAYAFLMWYTLSRTPAQVAKLVDALALGASEATHGGSSPLLGTIIKPDSCRVLLLCPEKTLVFERGLEEVEYIAQRLASTIRNLYRSCNEQDSSPRHTVFVCDEKGTWLLSWLDKFYFVVTNH